MSDTNKQTEDVHADHQHAEGVIDSDELFDLDMPLDEPEDVQDDPELTMQTTAPETENSDISDSLQGLMDEFPNDARQDSEDKATDDAQETLSSVENDLGHLLDRNDPDDEEEQAQVYQPMDTDEDVKSFDALTPSETERMTEMPAVEASNKKNRSGMAGSFMLSLGLIAILILSLAAWLGLDAAQQKSNLTSVLSDFQQQIQLLKQQQEQQKSQLTQQIEALEKRLNTLTQVIANKTTEQWRSSLQDKPAQHKTAPPQPKQADLPNKSEPTIKAVRQITANKTARVKKPAISLATVIKTPKKVKPVAKPSTTAKPSATANPLSMYEVAPGTVKGWVVNIFSVTSRSTAERKIRQLKSMDIDAKYVRVQIKGKTWYRVRTSGYKDERATITFKKFLKEYHGLDAWHSYLK